MTNPESSAETTQRPQPVELAAVHPDRAAAVPFLFNADEPRLFGFPRFYWLQLAFILLGVGTTTLVYQMTKQRR